jgi:hypothetical protein
MAGKNPKEPQHGKVRKHFRVNVSGITRALPAHLRAPFKAELERRLLARCGPHVTIADGSSQHLFQHGAAYRT